MFHADLVDLGVAPLEEVDIEEQPEKEEHLGEEDRDEKGAITRLPFEILNQTFAQLPFVERSTTTSLVCKRFKDVNRSHIYKYIHIPLGQQRKAGGQDNGNPLKEFGQLFATLLRHDHLRSRVVSLVFTVYHHDLCFQVRGHLENLFKHLKSLKELSFNPPPSCFDFPTNPTTTFLRTYFRTSHLLIGK